MPEFFVLDEKTKMAIKNSAMMMMWRAYMILDTMVTSIWIMMS